ncbi:MAG: hypothetical protein U9N45_01960 [Gemmatimonadota bacterium]|nr:hypothetical protein [Gemmatimonadota bacterium]
MTARKRKDPIDEFLKLKARIERSALELEQTEDELRALGSDMRADYISSMREAISPAGDREELSDGGRRSSAVNRMCMRCFNSCKQPGTVRILSCAKYEPI